MNHLQKPQYIFINELLVSGENLSAKTACVIGRAVADVLPIGDKALDQTEGMNGHLNSINGLMGFDITMAQEKTKEYFSNRLRVAYRDISPLSEENAKYWALGGIHNISSEEHKMWEDVEVQHLYNAFRKIISGV